LRVVRASWLVATSLTLCTAALAGCTASEISTDAGGPTTVAKTAGTTKGGGIMRGGIAASLAGASDPRAAAVGAMIDISYDPVQETTTTTTIIEETTLPPTTLPPVTVAPTTAKPIVTAPPTVAPTLPPVTIPVGKPVPQPMNGGLSADEQTALNTMNGERAKQGLPALVPESNAMSIARQHNTQMAATNGQPYSITANLFDLMPVAYQLLGQLEGYYPGDWVPPLKSQIGSYGQPYVYVGIGINKNSGGGVTYWTIIIGA